MSSMAPQNPDGKSTDVSATVPNERSMRRLVCVIDSDENARRRLESILENLGVDVAAFASAEEFLESVQREGASCLIAEIDLPGINGIALQQQLRAAGTECPVILVSHYGDVSTAVNAMQVGAIDFLEKPYRNHVILNMVTHALKVAQGGCGLDQGAEA